LGHLGELCEFFERRGLVFETDLGEAFGVVGEAGEADAIHGAGIRDVEACELAADIFKPALHLISGEGLRAFAEVQGAEDTAAQLALLGFKKKLVAEIRGDGEKGDAMGTVRGGVERGETLLPGGDICGKGVVTPAVAGGGGELMVEAGGEVEACVGDDGFGEGAEGVELVEGQNLRWGWCFVGCKARLHDGASLGRGAGAVEELLEGGIERGGNGMKRDAEGLDEVDDVGADLIGTFDGGVVAGTFENEELTGGEVGESDVLLGFRAERTFAVTGEDERGQGKDADEGATVLLASFFKPGAESGAVEAQNVGDGAFADGGRKGQFADAAIDHLFGVVTIFGGVAGAMAHGGEEFVAARVLHGLGLGGGGRGHDEGAETFEARGPIDRGARDEHGDLAPHGVASEEPRSRGVGGAKVADGGDDGCGGFGRRVAGDVGGVAEAGEIDGDSCHAACSEVFADFSPGAGAAAEPMQEDDEGALSSVCSGRKHAYGMRSGVDFQLGGTISCDGMTCDTCLR
jgi:hypothetical protein